MSNSKTVHIQAKLCIFHADLPVVVSCPGTLTSLSKHDRTNNGTGGGSLSLNLERVRVDIN